MLEKKCLVCNKTFKIYPSTAKRRKYCSSACYYKSEIKKPEAVIWPPERICNELKKLANELGRTPKANEPTTPSSLPTAAKRVFGSWNKAIIASGLKPNRVIPERMDKDEVTNEIIKFIEKEKRVPKSKEVPREVLRAAIRYFGSWTNALVSTGYDRVWNIGRISRVRGVKGEDIAPRLLKVLGYKIIEKGNSIAPFDYIVDFDGRKIAINVKYGKSWLVKPRNVNRLLTLGYEIGLFLIEMETRRCFMFVLR